MTTDDVLSRVLTAPGPAPGVDLSLFGRFAGSWALDCIEYDETGGSTTRRGEWHFGYGLGGLATVDVWILPGVEHGISVRFPAPEAGAGIWRSTWVGPGRHRVHTFEAAPDAEGIRLQGENLRWSFRDITPTTFRWTNEARDENGEWHLQQEFHVRREG